jgi:hypothetical protein
MLEEHLAVERCPELQEAARVLGRRLLAAGESPRP